MISDYVKGKQKFNYPVSIQHGIMLHRAIDAFTDSHDTTRHIKKYFQPRYRLYAGAFTDIVYDYFLANDPAYFPNEEQLMKFTERCYSLLQQEQAWLGPVFGKMFPYMRSQDWMYHYRFHSGIKKSFEGLRRRALYIPETESAMEIFRTHESDMLPYCHDFFESVKKFSIHTLSQLEQS
ncbi:MAG: DUF479 domain-containing protein [Niastella sp.]|nr:DUF479 domain-containing protein [Niastella sp.]